MVNVFGRTSSSVIIFKSFFFFCIYHVWKTWNDLSLICYKLIVKFSNDNLDSNKLNNMVVNWLGFLLRYFKIFRLRVLVMKYFKNNFIDYYFNETYILSDGIIFIISFSFVRFNKCWWGVIRNGEAKEPLLT